MPAPETSPASRFAGRVALVTGAASGIGRAAAALLAQQGARVLVADLDAVAAAQTAEAIAFAGGTAAAQPLDVTSEADWRAAVERVEQRWGGLHVLVNSAGIAQVRPVPDTSLAEWRGVLAVNLDGVFLGTRFGIQAMRRAEGGSIVNVASASGLKAAAGAGAYCASKAAVLMLTRVAALECIQTGDRIRVNAVAPGGVKTAMWGKVPIGAEIMASEAWNAPVDAPPGKRFATPDEVARAILFLASEEASYITGSVLAVDAGYTA